MKKKGVRGQGGQMIVEMTLLLVLLLGITYSVSAYFKSNEVLRQLISGPWQNLAGMLQNGIWAPPKVGAGLHPNAHKRHVVITGTPAK